MFDALDLSDAFAGIDAQAHHGCAVRACGLSAEVHKLIAEIGVLGIAEGRVAEAKAIFAYFDTLQEDNAAGAIGLALIETIQGREREAMARLRRAVATKKRCAAEAKAVLVALLIGFGRRGEAMPLRRELLRGPDCGARRLVAQLGTQ